MSDRVRSWTALAVIAGSIAIVATALASGETARSDRAQQIAARLKCPVCESESIADSPSQVARDSYNLIEERIDAGWTNEEIFDAFVATYGESVLLDPPVRTSTALLWLAPIVAVAIGGALIASRLSRPSPPFEENS